LLKPVIRRRGITTVGPPPSTAGPNRWIPTIRQVRPKNVIFAGLVISLHPPHAVPVVTTVVSKQVKIVSSSVTSKPSVIRIAPPKNTLPKATKGKVTVIGANYRLEGKVYASKPQKPVIVIVPCQWSGHFASHGWQNIQDQINAGYPIYIQPTLPTASYEEIVDFGTIFNNVIATLTWVQNLIAGAVTVVSKIATSTDNISYTAFTTGVSLFSASMRYVKFRFEFAASDDHGLVELLNVQTRLDVKREVDSGSITADKNDVNGTLATFNKVFKSIDSITLTVNSVEPVTAIYSSVTTTNFRIFAMDSQGNRITYTVSWKARGVV
jgi:hypothetical protein